MSEIDNIEAQARAEVEGLYSNTETTEQTSESNTLTSIEENNEPEEHFEENSEPQEPTIDREQIEQEVRKELEKEYKKKYYSKINQEQQKLHEAQKELEELKTTKWYSDDDIEAIRKIASVENQKVEISRTEQIEKTNFLNNFKPNAEDLVWIEEIKADFPNMSWEYARKVYLADKNPEALVKTKSPNLQVSWDTPKSIERWADPNDPKEIERLAREEAKLASYWW